MFKTIAQRGSRRMAESAALLVDEVFPEQPARKWVLSFPYPLRFLFASRPVIMGQVLGIVYRVIATHLIKKAGCTRKTAQAGAVTLIQRFGSALNLNIHFHILFLDGVYVDRPDGTARFRWVRAPTTAELTHLTHTIAYRVGRFLERQGWLERDADDCMDAGGRATHGVVAENCYLTAEAVDEDPMNPLLEYSITYRIAVGPQAGRKVFTLQTLPAVDEPFEVRWARWPVSVCMPAWRPRPMSGKSWSGCAVTSQGQRSRRSGCRSHRMATFATSSRRHTAMAPRM